MDSLRKELCTFCILTQTQVKQLWSSRGKYFWLFLNSLYFWNNKPQGLEQCKAAKCCKGMFKKMSVIKDLGVL